MARVIITRNLEEKINKKFKNESITIFKLMHSLKDSPKKGKVVGNVGGVVIKEIKYESYRFYFIADRYMLKVLDIEELSDLLIKFIRMSDKKDQQKVIDEIRFVLRKIGEKGF